MNEYDKPPKDENAILDTLREEIAGGLRYTHTRANANTRKLLEIASFAYAAIDLPAQKGLLQIEELDERKQTIAGRLVEKFIKEGMGITHQEKEQDKYAFEAVQIDCASRLALCKAACCKLGFALSKQDVEEGVVKWNFARPYFIAQGADGYCSHMDRGKLSCTIHGQRPVPCRGYDCRKDTRIWANFEERVVSPELDSSRKRRREWQPRRAMKLSG
jgi:Fe-S-cluster containining protein